MKKILSLLSIALYAHLTFSQVNPVWTNRYNGIGDFSDKWNAIALDGSGNIYVTGSTMVSGQYTDVATAKLNSLGDTLWVRTYNGLNNLNDKGSDIKVDASGNVYITGTVDNGTNGNDIITIKYSPVGNILWTSTYNAINQNDNATALVIDAAGNVYVTGYSDMDASVAVNNDYVTIQYNSSGGQQWVSTYNGTGNGTDQTAGIGVDNSGNVYVTGFSDSDPTAAFNNDYVTIQYNSAGVQQWLQVYNGGIADKPAALKTDGAGNTYITGRSGNGTNDDYYTIVYNSSGTALWNALYNGTGNGIDRPAAITYDASGNVYVTGQSDIDTSIAINYDYVTIKYNSTGVQQWLADYNNVTGNNSDIPNDISVDASGNIFVTGKSDADPTLTINYDYATIKYNSSGTQQWLQTYNGSANLSEGGNAMALDASGNCFVTGQSKETATQQDGTTIKYNSAGTQQWIKHYNGMGDNSDNGSAIAVDASGNAYVAGYTFGNGTDRDICVMKINSALGDTAWVRKYSGTANSIDQAAAIAVDASGNVYVTGFEKELSSGNNYITIKYNSTGVLQWAQLYNGLGNGTDKAAALAIDAAGNVYVTGYSDSDPSAVTNDDYLTIKYDPIGTQLWVTSYNGSANASDRATGIVADASGNIFVTGKSFNGTNYDFVTVEYNSSGVQQNSATYNGGSGDDIPNAITMDASANIYVAGQSAATNLFDDCATIKYNSTLVQQWAQTFSGAANRTDRANAIAVDGSGNVYVTGQTATDTSVLVKNYDYLTIKYNSAGVQQWMKTYNGQANTNDAAAGITLDATGNIYVTGQSDNGTSLLPNKDYVTIKYDSAGNSVWTATYNGTGNATDGANAIALSGSSVYVTGGSWGTNNSQKDIVTLKYNSILIGVSNIETQNVSVNIFPNPANDYLFIEGTTSSSEKIEVSILNIFGQQIMKRYIFAAGKFSEKLEIGNLAEGIYFIEIKSNDITRQIKFVKQ